MFQLILGSVAVTAAAATAWWSVSTGGRTRATVTRNLQTGLPPRADLRQASLDRSATDRVVAPLIGTLARRARRLTPVGRIEALERRILLAGTPRGWTVDRVLAAKLGLGALAVGLGGLRFLAGPAALTLLLWVLLTAFGFFGPDVLLVNMAQKRTTKIRRALPDTLDQLTISVEAGLGFDAALARTARSDRGPLANELLRTMQDVQAGMGRREAMQRLGERVDLAELRSFVHAVSQAEHYGLPVGSVLRVQAAELRTRRRQAAEERAVKLPVKLVFPTVFFIFPTLFIVLLGPAMINIMSGIFGR
jgi:tight adherence protein C